MSHLSTPEAPWGKPFTNKRYVHPPFAEYIITVWPSSMVLIGEITADNPHNWMDTESFGHGFSGELPSAGVIFTLKRDSDLLFRQRELSLYKAYTWQHELMPRIASSLPGIT